MSNTEAIADYTLVDEEDALTPEKFDERNQQLFEQFAQLANGNFSAVIAAACARMLSMAAESAPEDCRGGLYEYGINSIRNLKEHYLSHRQIAEDMAEKGAVLSNPSTAVH